MQISNVSNVGASPDAARPLAVLVVEDEAVVARDRIGGMIERRKRAIRDAVEALNAENGPLQITQKGVGPTDLPRAEPDLEGAPAAATNPTFSTPVGIRPPSKTRSLALGGGVLAAVAAVALVSWLTSRSAARPDGSSMGAATSSSVKAREAESVRFAW